MKTRLAALLMLVCGLAWAQPVSTIPSGTARRVIRGSALPATCSVGDVFEATVTNPGLYHGSGSPCAWVLIGPTTGSVGGASTLTTVGAIPIVSAAGVLGEATPWVQYATPYAPVTITTSGPLHSGTYTSGITATGSTGQTCTLTSLNGGGSSATATVALTGTNTIASGTALVVTAPGSGYTSSPTSATAGNGTATCSGTAVIATYLTVSPTGTGFYFPNLTAGNVAYILPAITSGTVGIQVCFRNLPTKTGSIKLKLPASTYIGLDGAYGSSAGTLVSTGALADSVCAVAADTTHYLAFVSSGTWTNN